MKPLFHALSNVLFKRKGLTIICMMAIVVSLYAVAYFLFLRTIEVDVTKDASIIYSGETQSASVKVENQSKAYNQRIQEFMDSISYKVTPAENIANGDAITITATFDETLASRYNINPINVIRNVKVKRLPIRYDKVSDIPKSYLSTISAYGKTYLRNNIKTILAEDFTTFYINSIPTLDKYKLTYRAFLNSNTNETKDKVIDVFAISANGESRNADGKDVATSETIYYMVTYNEINTSKKVLDENVYGEKIIFNGSYDLSKTEDFINYANGKYSAHYEVNMIDLGKK